MDMKVPDLTVEALKPALGAVIHCDRTALFDPEMGKRFYDLLEERGVLIFPKVNLSDKEQLAFTDNLGARVNFTTTAPGGDQDTPDVYTITLDKAQNAEPEYVLGTFFWHMDGVTIDQPPPKASVLTCRKTAPKGGQTQFASTFASFEALTDEERAELEGLRVVHSVVAAVREVATPEELEPNKRGFSHSQPLVWTHKSGRKSLMIGYSADYIEGMSKAEGRALLARLLEWTAQPAFTYSHPWSEGDLVVWDNTGALHRVIPYAADSGRSMRRTSVAGVEKAS